MILLRSWLLWLIAATPLAAAASSIRSAADTLVNGFIAGTITPIGTAVTAVAGEGDKATIVH